MTVRKTGSGAIELLGTCPSEDAEELLQLLLLSPDAAVNWEACETAHTAVIQLLLLARPVLRGVPKSPLLRDWVRPLMQAPDHANSSK